MPLPARVRAERRAQSKKLEDPKKFKRKRCDNCGELFRPERAYPVQKFCRDNCRKEFHKNGGNAFGPLKLRLEKLVRGITKTLEVRITKAELALLMIVERQGTANGTDAEAGKRAGGK